MTEGPARATGLPPARVVAIYTAGTPGAHLSAVASAVLAAGKGIVGDRYHDGTGTFSGKLADTSDFEVTLIEAEEVDAFNAREGLHLGPGAFRRNIVTRGVRLNALVGRRFTVGPVLLEGVRLCEPCSHLATLVTPKVLPGLTHRAGLRARILQSGEVAVGAPLTPVGD